MGTLLTSGGEWYLGVTEEGAPAAASACYLGACIYGVYLLFCGLKLKKSMAVKDSAQPLDEEEEM